MARKRLAIGVLLIGALALAACGGDDSGEESAGSSETTEGGSDAASEEPMKLVVASASSGLAYLQLDVALEQGFFEDHNLEIEILEVEGSNNATAAVESGQADLTILLPDGVINARAAGSTMKMIGETVDQTLYRIYSSPDVTSLDELAGKSVAMLVEGNGTDSQFRWLLDNHGAGADETTFIAAGGMPARLAAVQSGQANATFLVAPFDFRAEESGLNLLAEMKDYVQGYPMDVIAAREAVLEEKRPAFEAFMAAILDASEWIVNNPEDAIELAARVTGDDPEIMAESFNWMKDTYSLDGDIDPAGLQWALDVTEEYAGIEDLPTVEELYDDSFLP